MRRAQIGLFAVLVSLTGPFVTGCLEEKELPAQADGGPEAAPDEGTPHVELGGEAKIDLGSVDCGAAAKERSVTVKNTGKRALTYSLTLDNTAVFVLGGAASGTVEPGAEIALSLKTNPIAAASPPGVPLTGTVLVKTNDPERPEARVALSVTPRGGTLTLTPALAGFGDVNVQSLSPDTALAVKNTGNAPVKVAFAAPSSPEFEVGWTGQPESAEIAPGGTLAGAVARFKPQSAGTKSGTAALTVTGAVCGASAKELALSGNGTLAPVTVAPSPVDFGTTTCGTTAAAKEVTIANGNAFAVRFTAALGKAAASPYALSAASGTIPPKGTAKLTLTPKIIAIPASVATNAFGDTLTVTTDAPEDTPKSIPLTQSARGAILGLALGTSAFGNVPVGTSGTLPVTVTNTGNAPVNFALSTTGTGYAATPTAATSIAPAGTPAASATFTPLTGGAVAGTVRLTASGGALCAASPAAVNVTGTGTVAAVTLAPSPLNFPATSCGTTGTARTVTLTNSNAVAVPYSLALTGGAASRFALDAGLATSSAAGSIPARTAGGNGTTVVTIYPKPIATPASMAAGAYDGVLTVTTSGVAPSTQTVTITQPISGAFITASMAQPAFGNQSVRIAATRAVTLGNTGTMAANVTPSVGAPFSIGTAVPVNVPVGGSQSANVVFTPTAAGAASQSVAFAVSGAPICNGPIAPIAVSGTGIVPTSSAPPRVPIQVVCGAGPVIQSIAVTNTAAAGGASLVVDTLAVSGNFTLLTTSLAPIAPGASGTIQVRATAVVGTDLGGSSDLGFLTFRTNESGNPTKSLTLIRGVSGANLEYIDWDQAGAPQPITSLSNPVCNRAYQYYKYFGMRNTGSADATVNVIADGGVPGAFTSFSPEQGYPNPVPLVSGGTIRGINLLYDAAAGRGPYTRTFTPAVTASGPICRPLPPLPITEESVSTNDPRCVIIL